MKTAFISHATLDDRFVVELKGLILSLGYEFVFNDADYDSIRPDEEFWPRIVEGIQAADALVVVITEESAVSTWVNKEVEYARNLKKRVVPILIEDCDIPELFRDRDVIDFRQQFRNPCKTNNGRALGIYLERLNKTLKSKQGVLTYLPRTGYVDDFEGDDVDDDEFGFSVLVEGICDSSSSSSNSGSLSTDSSQCPMALTEAVERHRAVVIIGEPGAGKSTTIRRMAQVMAANFDKSGGNASVPILLDLTRWPKGKELNDAIEDACQGTPDMASTLQRLNHSIFLDGLNEVSDKETLNAIVRNVKEASLRTGPLGLQHLIITCRSDDYLAENDDGTSLKQKLGMPSITIRDMGRKEIEAFCETYLSRSSKGMIRIIQQNDLWELAGNAYMLCALIFIYEKLGAESFPTNKGDLFPRMTKALWTREIKRGYSGELTYLELTPRLGELAHWVTLEYGFGKFDLAVLPERLDPQRTVSGLARRCGLLYGTGDQIRFNHQLTQEYFTAEWFKATELNASTSSEKIRTTDFRNSFRILGGMGAEHLGLKLFAIAPLSLAQWVLDGVYSRGSYTALVTNLLRLLPGSDYWGEEYRALELVVKYDLTLSEPVLVDYLERADSNLRSIVIALRTIQTLSFNAQQRALQLLNDSRCYTLYTRGNNSTVPSRTEYRVRDLAVDAIFRLGQDEATAAAIVHVFSWLDDSTIVKHEHWNDTHGYEEYYERLGNRAFTQLWNGPAVGNAELRQALLEWLEAQEDAEGVAKVTQYNYGGDFKMETSQAEWARSMRFGSRTN